MRYLITLFTIISFVTFAQKKDSTQIKLELDSVALNQYEVDLIQMYEKEKKEIENKQRLFLEAKIPKGAQWTFRNGHVVFVKPKTIKK